MRKMKLVSTVIMSCFAGTVAAQQEQDLMCFYGYEKNFLPVTDLNPETSPTKVKADDVFALETGTSIFRGNVNITRAGRELTSDRATYRRSNGDMTAHGNVRMRDSDMIIDADQAEWSTEKDEGRMLNGEYRIREQHARGEASHLLRRGRSSTDLLNATYTTCAEGNDTWLLDASEVHLDHETAVGEAEDVVIRIKGFPVFYTPYINFPLNDERKSGFLVPSIGVSSKTGFDALTPYYFNIAPNLDATLTPRYMSERGLMMGGQFRYLFESGEGEFEAQYLNSDSQEKEGDELNRYYEEDRKLFSWQHTSYFDNRWRARVDYNYVSDGEYFRDFGSGLNTASTVYMNRLVETGYTGNSWDFTARLQGYQTLEDVPDQYKRMPQLLFRSYLPEQALGLTYEMEAEYVEFDHKDLVDGQRINFQPSMSLPMGTAGFFATPRVAIDHTQYSLQNDVFNQFDDSASRTVPISSFDTGLVFEREMKWGDTNYVQTLEPRAFYLYIPYRDQSDIPQFDTSLSTFNMVQLFSYDRFIGRDRIGDANQLSLGLTTRFIDEQSGQEALSLTVGQIRYFDDRKVTLLGNPEQTDTESDMVAEAIAYINNEWSVQGEIQWDQSELQSSMSSVGVRYRGEDGGIFNVFHRYRRDDPTQINNLTALEQLDVSASLPINERWSMFGRYYRALDTGEMLEGLAGVQYDACCWSVRMAMRSYVDSIYDPATNRYISDDERNNSFYVQFELKGLGAFGNSTESLLQRSIRGYEEE